MTPYVVRIEQCVNINLTTTAVREAAHRAPILAVQPTFGIQLKAPQIGCAAHPRYRTQEPMVGCAVHSWYRIQGPTVGCAAHPRYRIQGLKVVCTAHSWYRTQGSKVGCIEFRVLAFQVSVLLLFCLNKG